MINGLVPKVIEKIKNFFPEIGVISDVALDPYTSHGQDGFVNNTERLIMIKLSSYYVNKH